MNNDSSIGVLASRLRDEIARLQAGDRLPSSRTLMERHKVSPVTVSRALSLLASEGLVVTRPGSGTFVAARALPSGRPPDFDWQAVALADRSVDVTGVSAMLPVPPEGSIPLNGGYLHASLQPVRALTGAAARAVRRQGAWERPPLNGLAALRAWFARSIGPDVAPDDVLITNGGQAALATTLRALLAPGAALLVESPTYPGVLMAARAAGLHTVPVPVDRQGVRPDLLAEAFAQSGARAFYCQPTFQNPTGQVLTAERRGQVLAVARAAGAFIVEDDYARDLIVSPSLMPPPLAAQDPDGTVVHLSSLTKITAPSLRIAAIMARGPVAERLRCSQLVDTFFPARPLQETALDLVTSPAWPRHLGAVRSALRQRQDAIANAIRRDLPGFAFTPPPGGLHLWTTPPHGLPEAAIVEAAARAGVTIGAGRPFYPAEPPGPRIRFTYGGATSEAELAEGIRRVAQAVHTLTTTRPQPE